MSPREDADVRRVTAFHEAAHSVVQYRAGGRPTAITIFPQPELHTLGHDQDGSSDSESRDDMEAVVLSCYAGRHAQARIDPADDSGCDIDDEIAFEILRRFDWDSREQELRSRSAALVEAHWSEISAVAEELLRRLTLDEEEVEMIADGASDEELAQYRQLRLSN